MTPAGNENTSHGSLEATPTTLIHNASRVRDEASHTTATDISPSPRFVMAEAEKSFQ